MSDSVLVDAQGNPLRVNGHSPAPRTQVINALQTSHRRSRSKYDAARDTEEYRRHWANADSLDADSANNKKVRHDLMKRSRYEEGSNGYYDGILTTHCNMVVGVGPKLRMLTRSRPFNQLVEREFLIWAEKVELRRKLWCLCHALNQDGEGMAVLVNNPALTGSVQLDLVLIEGEQCQTPFLPHSEPGYIDGLRYDPVTNQKLWYDVLPYHPGAAQQFNNMKPVRVVPRDMLHWFKLKRPGTHRGIPSCTSTLNLGASTRRVREATVAKVETEADYTVFLKSLYPPNELDQTDPLEAFEIEKRMAVTLPNNLDVEQLKNTTPGTNYTDFNRLQISEQARPLSMPYNAAACDSSTYSFASGKLDTLCYRAAIDVERADGDCLALDPIFAEWFREWNTVVGRNPEPPVHQWDWPVHPVIDAVAEANATDTKLRNGTITLRQVYSDQGQDLEDQLNVMADDYFGDASEENVLKMRQILLQTHYPTSIPPAPVAAAPVEKSAALAAREFELACNMAQLKAVPPSPQGITVNVPKPDPIIVPAPVVHVAAPNVTVEAAQVHLPEPVAPVVNVAAPNVTVEAAQITLPEQAAPIVNVAGAVINVPESAPPIVNVAAAQITLPEQAAPIVNVAGPVINVPEAAAPIISVTPVINVPEAAAPVINVAPAQVTVEAAVVNVPKADAPVINVAAPIVDVHIPPPAEFDIEPVRDAKTKLVKRYRRIKKQ